MSKGYWELAPVGQGAALLNVNGRINTCCSGWEYTCSAAAGICSPAFSDAQIFWD